MLVVSKPVNSDHVDSTAQKSLQSFVDQKQLVASSELICTETHAMNLLMSREACAVFTEPFTSI